MSSPNISIGGVTIMVLKQGTLLKTKLVEGGKKQRKDWRSCHVVLTDKFLMFFRNSKDFGAMQQSSSASGGGSSSKGSGSSSSTPEINFDLKGAEINWSDKSKSRKNNVFEVSSALLGTTILLQVLHSKVFTLS